MNIKSLLALATIATIGAASATVTTTNTLVRIHVASSEASTIVAIPLVAVGTLPNAANPTIAPNNLVLTENLSVGDSILHWNTLSMKWDAWMINESRAWQAVNTLDGFEVSTTAPASDTALAMGDAIWVNRTGKDKALSYGFYIYGQAGTGTTSTTRTGTSASPVYTLIGNTTLGDVALSSVTFATPTKGDKIVWGDKDYGYGHVEYTWNGAAWGNYVSTTTEKDFLGETVTVIESVWNEVGSSVIIPAGQGVWYVGYGSSVTVTWPAASSN